MMNDEPALFECEECGVEYDPDREGADGMCKDCSDNAFENYGSDDEI